MISRFLLRFPSSSGDSGILKSQDGLFDHSKGCFNRENLDLGSVFNFSWYSSALLSGMQEPNNGTEFIMIR